MLSVAAACAREAAAPPKETSPTQASARDLVVLPNNTAIYARNDRILAVRREGEVMWEASLPMNDLIIAPVGVALNSSAYVRGSKALHAITPEGKWAWSKPLEAQAHGKTPTANAPATFPDSTVAVVVGDDIVRFDDKGVVRWRFHLPEGHVTAPLRAGMDGALFVPTTAGLYCLNPDGSVAWLRAVGN